MCLFAQRQDTSYYTPTHKKEATLGRNKKAVTDKLTLPLHIAMPSSQTRSTSGVRGLKALFEKPSDDINETAISPSPSFRGRSPLGQQRSDSSNSNTSERHSSKIRASFVSVEKPGRQLLTPPKPSPPQRQAGPEMESEGQYQADHRRASSTRRGSFSFTDESAPAIAELRKTISNEEERRQNESSVAETIPEAAVEATPLPKMAPTAREDMAAGIMTPKPGHENEMGREVDPMATHAASRLKEMDLADEQPSSPAAEGPTAPKTLKAETPGKMVLPEETSVDTRDKFDNAAEEEAGEMKPAEPADGNAVSGGEALPPVAEDLRHHETTEGAVAKPAQEQAASPSKTAGRTPHNKANSTKPTPSPLSSKPTPRRSMNSLKSPSSTSQPPKSPAPTNAQPENDEPPSPKPSLPKKASRSSLTAPTAASSARAASSGDLSQKPASTKPTASNTLSSRLTAPTAASKARNDTASTNGNGAAKPPSSTRSLAPKTPSTTRPAPRSSVQRPESRSSQPQPPPRRTTPAGEGFLERMMRPTAASASRAHDKSDKVEVKSPPRPKTGAAVGRKQGVYDTRGKAGFAGQKKGGALRLGTAKSQQQQQKSSDGVLETSVLEEAEASAKDGDARVEESEGVNGGNEVAREEVREAEEGTVKGLGADVDADGDGEEGQQPQQQNGVEVNAVGDVS